MGFTDLHNVKWLERHFSWETKANLSSSWFNRHTFTRFEFDSGKITTFRDPPSTLCHFLIFLEWGVDVRLKEASTTRKTDCTKKSLLFPQKSLLLYHPQTFGPSIACAGVIETLACVLKEGLILGKGTQIALFQYRLIAVPNDVAQKRLENVFQIWFTHLFFTNNRS